MKTILHTIDTTGPGGAETVFIDIASRLPAERFRPVVCIRGEGWVYDELRRRGFDPVIIPAKGSFNVGYLRALAGLIRQERVDIVHSHLLGASVYCSLAGLITSTPVIATFHGLVDIGLDERFKTLKTGAINLGAKAIVAVSNNLRRSILRHTSMAAAKIRVIYNGVDTAGFERAPGSAIRERFGWSGDDIVVGCLGNVRPAKGYDVLLRAAAGLGGSERRFRFVIAGQGMTGLSDQLDAYLEREGLQASVQFLGFCEDPADFLANLDIFLLPSTSEGFSIATIQAMAAGLPVLVTRSGGPEEIVVHGETGYMIEPGVPAEISDALQLLAADDGLRRRIAAGGKAHAGATFGIDAMIDSYVELYDG